MQSIHAAITINRPIDEVWEYVSDLRNKVEWFTGIKAVRMVSTGEHGVGTELELYVHLFGWRFTSYMRITDFVPPGRITMLSARSPVHYSGTYRLEPANDGTATNFTLDAIVIAGSFYRLFGPAFGPLLRITVQRRFAVLKRLLENASDRHGSTR